MLTVVQPWGHRASAWTTEALQVAAGVFASILAVAKSVRKAGAQRAGWGFIGGAALSWTLARIGWTYHDATFGMPPPFPYLTDIGHLLMYPLVIGGLLFLAGPDGNDWARTLVDAAIVACAAALVMFDLVLEATFGTVPGLPLKVGILYAVGDFAMVVTAMRFAFAQTSWAQPTRWLVLAVLNQAVADTSWVALTAYGTYVTGSPLDVGWIMAMVLIAAAALAPGHPGPSTPSAASHTVFLYLPAMAATTVLAIVIGHVLRAEIITLAEFLLVLPVLGGVLARQALGALQLRKSRVDLQAQAAELSATNEKLREADDMKNRFINSASHELNTPLTPLKLQMAVLMARRSAVNDGREARSLELMSRNLDRLAHLVGDLLEASRIQSGRAKISIKRVSVDRPIEEVVSLFQALAEQQGIRLGGAYPAGLYVAADDQRVSQMLTNLVSNAIKYTPRGGTVSIDAAGGRDFVEIRVRDTGPALT